MSEALVIGLSILIQAGIILLLGLFLVAWAIIEDNRLYRRKHEKNKKRQ